MIVPMVVKGLSLSKRGPPANGPERNPIPLIDPSPYARSSHRLRGFSGRKPGFVGLSSGGLFVCARFWDSRTVFAFWLALKTTKKGYP